MQFNGRILTCLIMLVVFLAFTIQAFFFQPAARVMPLLVGVPGTALCFWQLLVEINTVDGEPNDGIIFSRSELAIAAWLLAFIAGVLALGFSFGAPPLVACYLYFVAKERPGTVLIAGVFCFALMYGFFERIMKFQLFEGLLVQYFW